MKASYKCLQICSPWVDIERSLEIKRTSMITLSHMLCIMSYLRDSNLIINLMLMFVLRYRGDVAMCCPEVAYSTIKWEWSKTHWHALFNNCMRGFDISRRNWFGDSVPDQISPPQLRAVAEHSDRRAPCKPHLSLCPNCPASRKHMSADGGL